VCDAHAQRLAQATRTGAEQMWIVHPPPGLHDVEAGGWLQRPDQNGAARQTDEIQAPVNPVRAIHVSMARRTKHGRISRGETAEAMGCRIVAGISLGLDDHAATALDEEGGANQVPSDRHGVVGEKGLEQGC